MMELTHATVGAFIGKEVGSPYAVIFLSIFSHFIVDKIKHFWPKLNKNKFIFAGFGYAFTLIFILFLFNSSEENKNLMIIGALSGVLVDTIINGIYYVRKSRLGVWHSKRQPHTDKVIFLFPEVVFCFVLLILLFR